jgi:multisubunit Na+/H+ antiporter MnhB subunit
MISNPEQPQTSQNSVSPQILYDRSRASGMEMFKLLTQLSTAAVGVFFIALSTNINPPLTHEQRFSVLAALSFMVITLLCGVFGIAADAYFYESWARSLSGKNADTNWKHRERANRVRKLFTFAAMLFFLLGAFAAARYIYLRTPR